MEAPLEVDVVLDRSANSWGWEERKGKDGRYRDEQQRVSRGFGDCEHAYNNAERLGHKVIDIRE